MRILVLSIAWALLLPSCISLNTSQAAVVEQAEAIRDLPMSRDRFVNLMGLGEVEGYRSNGIIGHGLFHREAWWHPTGLIVTATKAVPANIDYSNIDELLRKPGQSDFTVTQPPVQTEFDSFVITKNTKMVYQSW